MESACAQKNYVLEKCQFTSFNYNALVCVCTTLVWWVNRAEPSIVFFLRLSSFVFFRRFLYIFDEKQKMKDEKVERERERQRQGYSTHSNQWFKDSKGTNIFLRSQNKFTKMNTFIHECLAVTTRGDSSLKCHADKLIYNTKSTKLAWRARFFAVANCLN